MTARARNSFVAIAALATVLTAAGISRAETAFDPAARAKVVAPFIDPQTVAVAHVDLSRVPVAAVVDQLGRWVPEAKADTAKAGLAASAWLTGFQALGGREIFVVVSLADVDYSYDGGVFLVVPAGPDANEEGLAALLPFAATQRHGNVLLSGHAETIKRLIKLQPEPRPEVVDAFRAAGDTAAQGLLLPPKYAARVVEEMLPTWPKELGGGSTRAITHGLRWAAVGVDLSGEMALRLAVQSTDADAARAMRSWWINLVRAVGSMDEVKREFPGLAELGVQLAPEVRGNRLALELTAADPRCEAVRKTVAPIMAKARAKAQRAMSANSLKQLGLAMHNYHGTHRHFPTAAICDKQGKPLLSWRVALLPYLDKGALYREFHLDEPWDSPHNRELIAKMPAVYRSAASPQSRKGHTSMLAPVGLQTVFPPGGGGVSMKDIADGASNTVMLVELDDKRAVPWTKPEDWAFDAEKPAKGLMGPYPGGVNMLFCDGHVQFVGLPAPIDWLRGLFTRAGKEAVAP